MTLVLDLESFRWQRDALCIEYPEIDYFPEDGGISAEAYEICDRCLVQLECADFVLSHGEPYGVWGGLAEEEGGRPKVYRGDLDQPTKVFTGQRASCGTPSGYNAHRNKHEPPCLACRQSKYQANRRGVLRKREALAEG